MEIFEVVYTKQKLQKNKTWIDGTLKIIDDKKVQLLNEDGQIIETRSFENGFVHPEDGYLTLPKHLISVGDRKPTSENSKATPTATNGVSMSTTTQTTTAANSKTRVCGLGKSILIHQGTFQQRSLSEIAMRLQASSSGSPTAAAAAAAASSIPSPSSSSTPSASTELTDPSNQPPPYARPLYMISKPTQFVAPKMRTSGLSRPKPSFQAPRAASIGDYTSAATVFSNTKKKDNDNDNDNDNNNDDDKTVGQKRKQSLETHDSGPQSQDPIRMPTRLQCGVKVRSVQLPLSFNTLEQYKTTMLAAVHEELCLMLRSLGESFHAVMGTSTSPDGLTPYCDCKAPCKLLVVKKPGKTQGKSFFACSNSKCKYFKWEDEVTEQDCPKQTLPQPKKRPLLDQKKKFPGYYYGELIYTRPTTLMDMGWKKKKKKTSGADYDCVDMDFVEDSNAAKSNQEKDGQAKAYFKFQSLEPQSTFGKDDLWVFSPSSEFDREDSWVLVATSAFYGKSEVIEVSFLNTWRPALERSQMVYALHGPAVATEMAVAEMLSDSKLLEKFPLLPALLRGNLRQSIQTIPRSLGSSSGLEMFRLHERIHAFKIEETFEAITQQFNLNEDQIKVLSSVKDWFDASKAASHVTLIFGPFGTGKTTLLVAVIVFLSQILSACNDDKVRIVVCSATNVAVDRILTGLLKANFVDFVRVGSLKRIAKPVLKYTVHESQALKEHKSELEMLLHDAQLSEEERKHVISALADCNNGNVANRIKLLKKTRVMGVTCASTTKPILDGHEFPICILDECSQMIEPVSLLPLAKFGCRALVAAGDPKQLPPTLSAPSDAENRADKEPEDLSRTMFSRLSKIGIEPIMLRTQYRLDPAISRLPNRLFYNNALINGDNTVTRGSLVPGLQPLLFFDVVGQESLESSGSIINEEEISFISWFVTKLTQQGVSAGDIGIICLYKAQAAKIQSAVSLKGVQISTVDAFQGAEKEIIVVSTCRTGRLGFIESPNRLNVAITRAMRHLCIVGNHAALRQSPMWRFIVESIREIPGGFHSALVAKSRDVLPGCV